MRTVLLVGTDPLALRSLGDCLAVLGPRLRVLTAAGGEAAAARLAAERIDVLVTQLVMPKMDGFELAAFALRHQPALEVVLMERREWGRVRQALAADGAFRFLSQPVEPQQLIEAVLGERAGDARGQLSGLSLAGMLQLLAVEGRSCAVRVTGARGDGRVEISNGAVVNAMTGESRGRDALFELLGWEDAGLELQSLQGPVHRRIDEPLAQLLLEAAHRQDEGRHATAVRFDPPDAAPALAPLAALAGFELAAVLDPDASRCLATASRGDPQAAARYALGAARDALRAIPETQRGWLRQIKVSPGQPLQMLRFLRGHPQAVLFVSADAEPAAVHAALDQAEARYGRAGSPVR